MLAPNAEADKPRRYSSKKREPFEQAQGQRHLVEHGLADHQRGQHAVVNRPLGALDDFRRKHPPLLHLVEQVIDIFSTREGRCEDVRRGNRVLDCEIDAYTADR